MPAVGSSVLGLIQQVVVALVAAAAAVFLATWSKSPVRLPLPTSQLNRWLRAVPLLAAAVIIGILSTRFTDCSYLRPLIIVSLTAFLLCAGLMLLHHYTLQKTPGATTLLIAICFGWSILGTLLISSMATVIIAWQRMEDVYNKNPLMLWQVVEGQKRAPKDAIYLTAGLPIHFRAEMDECHNTTPEMSLSPTIGRLTYGTYHAPDVIKEEQQITITAKSIEHQDTKTATIILLPDPPNIKRVQYPGRDKQDREALFDFIIISKNDSWVYGSEEFIERNRLDMSEESQGRPHNTPVCGPIIDLAGSHAFDPYVDIIAIGTASREGTHAEETRRAGRRSQRIAEWLNSALREASSSKHVYMMNLGQYHPGVGEGSVRTKDDTAQERPVVLIGVVRQGEIDLRDALRSVFEQHQENDFFRFLSTHYPGREISPYGGLPESVCPIQ